MRFGVLRLQSRVRGFRVMAQAAPVDFQALLMDRSYEQLFGESPL